MEELIHRRMIWSILQLLNLSCVHSLEIHDSGLLLQHLIFPLQRCHRKNQVLTNGLFDQYNRKACPLSPYSNHEIWQIMEYCITMQEAHPSVSCKVLQTTAVLSPTSWKYRFLIFIRLSRLPACVWPHKLQSFPWRIRIFFGGEGRGISSSSRHPCVAIAEFVMNQELECSLMSPLRQSHFLSYQLKHCNENDVSRARLYIKL